MKYKVHYFHNDLSHITYLKNGQIIISKTLLKLIESKTVNIMIQHLKDGNSICWIDSGKFKQK